MTFWDRLTFPFRRQRGRPLSTRQPAADRARTVPLGMEAIDMKHVASVARRNDALERANTIHTGRARGSFAQNAATHIEPMPDDETYATAFHRAFNTKDTTQ